MLIRVYEILFSNLDISMLRTQSYQVYFNILIF